MFEQILHRVVRVHCGSAHVSGRARQFRYVAASLFETAVTADGRYVYRNTGLVCGPRTAARINAKKKPSNGLWTTMRNLSKGTDPYTTNPFGPNPAT
jgi:hypothetical protein